MRNFFRRLKGTLNNFRDPEKRRIVFVKTFRLQNWVNTRRILTPIILGNVFGIVIYLYYYNEDFSLKLSVTRKVSKITGTLTNLHLPLFFRKRIFHSFSRLYGVNLDEIKEDLESFSTFNEFFTREVKPRTIDPTNPLEIVSPADSKVLAISEITGNETLLIKGQKYKLGHFLTGMKDYEIKGEILDSMKKKSSKNKIYHVIFYLNPGDYHRFHSPMDFFIKKRLHLVGYLYPVRESYIATHKEVFETNERIAVFGESQNSGFVSLVFVGALNVGTISLTFDPEIRTNQVLQRDFPRSVYRDFARKKGKDMVLQGLDIAEFAKEEQFSDSRNQKSGFERDENGIKVGKGVELGRFNMGSTVVLFFEADETFQFQVKEGQKVRYGDVIGRFGAKVEEKTEDKKTETL